MQKTHWVSMDKFIEHYDLNKSYAYELANSKGFPTIRVGDNGGHPLFIKTTYTHRNI